MPTVDGGSDGRPTWLLVVPWDLQQAGGVNTVVVSLYRQIRASGHFRPLVLVIDWQATTPRPALDEEFNTVYLRLREAPRSLTDVLRWLVLGARELGVLRAFIEKENVRVVNIHYPGYSVFPFALLKRLGRFRARLILSFHGQDFARASHAKGLRTLAWRFFAHESDSASACSESLARNVRSLFGNAAAKVRVVLNGIDCLSDREIAALETGKRGADDEYVLNAATYEWKKGQDVLIRAFAMLARDHPEYHLVLVGREEGMKTRLAALCDELHIADRVTLLDVLSHRETLALCRDAQIFVLSSRIEPFGLVILEAGMLGVPVIATDVGGVSEIITSEDYGKLVAAEDPVALAAAMREVIADPQAAARKAQKLNGRVREQFTSDRTWRELEALAETRVPR